MAKGYKIVITHFLRILAKCNYLALALPRPRIVFCLQPLEVGYNYYLQDINIAMEMFFRVAAWFSVVGVT